MSSDDADSEIDEESTASGTDSENDSESSDEQEVHVSVQNNTTTNKTSGVRNITHRRDGDRTARQTTVNWNDVTAKADDTAGLSYRFVQKKPPGPTENLSENSEPLHCLLELLTDNVLDDLIRMINEYAVSRVNQNALARRRSVFRNWKPLSKYELLKFLAVLIAMGLDKRPAIRDYWSTYPAYHSSWYHEMFSRDRFESIYHTMLHASHTDSVSKDKTEPFLNTLISKFQDAFYPYTKVAIDEMVIGWKER